MDYIIEKNKTIPSKQVVCKYPFPDMEKGDSFFYEGQRQTIAVYANHWANKFGGKFSVRKEGQGFRVFRVE